MASTFNIQSTLFSIPLFLDFRRKIIIHKHKHNLRGIMEKTPSYIIPILWTLGFYLKLLFHIKCTSTVF